MQEAALVVLGPEQRAFGEWRPLMGQMGLRPDQDHATVEAVLAHRLGGAATGVPGADDDERGHRRPPGRGL